MKWICPLGVEVTVLAASIMTVSLSHVSISYAVSFESINRYSSDTNDIEKTDDVRSFTSEALFAQSEIRLDRPLNEDELRQIARTKNAFETFNNLRFSLNRKQRDPAAFDLYYKFRKVSDAQITNFFQPAQLNEVRLNQLGITAQGWLLRSSLFLRVNYNHAKRTGVVEFMPDTSEAIETFELNAALRFGNNPNTSSLFASYLNQDIEPDVPSPPKRERRIAAVGFTIGQEQELRDPRPLYAIDSILQRRFDPRGLKIYGSYVADIETYGVVDVTKTDLYVGGSFPVLKATHIAIQPTYFTSEVENDPTQDNAQIRLGVKTLYQATPDITLVFPFKYDQAATGPGYYNNWRIGAMLRYVKESANQNWYLETYFRIGYQQFVNLEKKMNLYEFYLLIAF